ncbi:ProB [Salmonella phage 19]|nr:ProB [Salmonella phage 19]
MTSWRDRDPKKRYAHEQSGITSSLTRTPGSNYARNLVRFAGKEAVRNRASVTGAYDKRV